MQDNHSFYLQKLSNIINDVNIRNIFFSFLNKEEIANIKTIFRLNNNSTKQYKRILKNFVTRYIIDFGKNNDKVKYSLKDHTLRISTNIFNINQNYLYHFTDIIHKNENIFLNEEELHQYLKLTTEKNIFFSSNKDNNSAKIKISKYIITNDHFDKTKKNNNDSKNSNENEYYPLKFITNIKYWSIILCSGGNFAFGLFLKDEEIEHKSDHKYTIRKKAGKRQIVKDKSKNINSIGAQIRRANEKKHQENIEDVLKENDDFLEKCDCIFIQAPGLNKNILLGENKLLNKYKNKLYNLPLNLPKANYSNICFAFKTITNCSLEINNMNLSK